jgi:hypothetical protein
MEGRDRALQGRLVVDVASNTLNDQVQVAGVGCDHALACQTPSAARK